jgi:hypothetical protein
MKIQISKPFLKSSLIGFGVTTLAFLFTSCSKKISFLNSSVVPAASGTVKVGKDKNQNYLINLDISNLAEVGRLTPPGKTYIVWMEAAKNTAKNIGQIASSTRTFSNKLEASFESISPIKPTKIFITAEDNASVQYPSDQVVLTTNRF